MDMQFYTILNIVYSKLNHWRVYMFETDIAIYNFLKKIAIKIIPAFGVESVGIPIGGILFDVAVVLVLTFIALSKVSRIQERVKK